MPDLALTGLLDLDAEPVRDFFRQAPVMMHAIDDDGCITAVSRYWAARLGYLPDEMIGRKSIDLVTPASRRIAVEEALPRFLRDGEIQRQPYDFVRKDGTVLPVLLSAIALRSTAGVTGRGLAFMTENDERDDLQRDLQLALLRTDRAHRAKSQFLTAMSHELRTPMNAVLGFAQLLSLTELDPKQTAHVEAIRASGHQLMTRLQELLDLSQLEFSDFSLSPEAVETKDLIAPVLARWRPAIEAKALNFEHDIAVDTPKRMHVDVARLQQILAHFLSNALYHTETGRILLAVRKTSAKETGDWVEYSVSDTGPGIDPRKREHLFERFSEKELDFTKSGGGWGVGLSICRGLADAMGAEIGARSDPDTGGAVFYIRFQLAPKAEGVRRAEKLATRH